MVFNILVAAPLVLMVIQFARIKPGEPGAHRKPRRNKAWEEYQRTMKDSPTDTLPLGPVPTLGTRPLALEPPQPPILSRRPTNVPRRPSPSATSRIPVVLKPRV